MRAMHEERRWHHTELKSTGIYQCGVLHLVPAIPTEADVIGRILKAVDDVPRLIVGLVCDSILFLVLSQPPGGVCGLVSPCIDMCSKWKDVSRGKMLLQAGFVAC